MMLGRGFHARNATIWETVTQEIVTILLLTKVGPAGQWSSSFHKSTVYVRNERFRPSIPNGRQLANAYMNVHRLRCLTRELCRAQTTQQMVSIWSLLVMQPVQGLRRRRYREK